MYKIIPKKGAIKISIIQGNLKLAGSSFKKMNKTNNIAKAIIEGKISTDKVYKVDVIDGKLNII